MSIVNAVLRSLSMLLPEQRRKLPLLVLLIVTAAALEMLSVGMILPFVDMLSDPSVLRRDGWLSQAFAATGFQEERAFIIFFSVLFGGLFIVRSLFLSLVAFARHRFIYLAMYSLISRLLRGYLTVPYRFHLHRNSAEITRILFTDANHAVSNILVPAIVIFTEVVISGSLILLLIWIKPVATSLAILVFIALMSVIYLFYRHRVTAYGETLKQSAGKMLQWINQSIGSIPESYILNRQSTFLEVFKDHCKAYADARVAHSMAIDFPRFLVEGVVVLAVMLLIAVLYAVESSTDNAVPFLAMFALGAVRIMPSAIRCYNSLIDVRAGIPALNAVYDDYATFNRLGIDMVRSKIDVAANGIQTPSFDHSIDLQHISFQYESADKESINNISLSISKGEAIGIVGPSGAGKSTLLSIILGLLTPSNGAILIDGQNVEADIQSWQRRIGYIPQSIFLLDDSVKANIAFGVPEDDVDGVRLVRAIELAQLRTFVSSLPEKELTMVGENGVRISGGQRQRIAIARALYHEPEILVLDEATASLDNETERQITAAIRDLMGIKTIIVVAHRLSTVESCSRIVFIESGSIVAEGTYEELMSDNRFRQMAVGQGVNVS